MSAYQPIDVDSHVIEPADLWTSRVSTKWGDLVPHVRWYEPTQEEVWFIGDEPLSPVGIFAMVGWRNLYPNHPPRYEDASPEVLEAKPRLDALDRNGICAQVIYPNLVGGFFANRFMQLDPGLALECVQAYNDFQTDFCSVAPDRLLALTALPFWDVDASVREIERCIENGHRGVLFAHTFEQIGLPNIPDERWHPILDAAQSLGQSINFHIGFTADAGRPMDHMIAERDGGSQNIVDKTAQSFVSNARAINHITVYGVCQRYPDLNFVLVESGFGFIPYQLQALDWQWDNNGMRQQFPGWLTPSEYFSRQIYSTFWFEKTNPSQLTDWQDNVMWETDFPHPTAMWPTPTSQVALPAQEAIEHTIGDVSEEVRRKVLFANAARLYRVQ